MKDLGPYGQFTRTILDWNTDKKTIFLFEAVYLRKTLDYFGMSDCKPAPSLIGANTGDRFWKLFKRLMWQKILKMPLMESLLEVTNRILAIMIEYMCGVGQILDMQNLLSINFCLIWQDNIWSRWSLSTYICKTQKSTSEYVFILAEYPVYWPSK